MEINFGCVNKGAIGIQGQFRFNTLNKRCLTMV